MSPFEAGKACGAAGERARVVSWLRDLPTAGNTLAWTGSVRMGSVLRELADRVESGEHDEARAGGAQEPRSGGTRGRP